MVPLDFSYVVFDESSTWSLIMAYITFVPILLTFGIVIVFVARRELEYGYFFCGCLCSTIVNAALKRVIQQPRPVGSAKGGYGMPSDHVTNFRTGAPHILHSILINKLAV